MLFSLGITTWEEKALSDLAAEILMNTPKPLILIDGVAGSGKTTLAMKLVDVLDAGLVHTDDVCWCADPVNWDDEMLNGIIHPWIDKKNVAYKPTGWAKENRSGFIKVDSNKALIIEGMGACRKTLREVATYSVWVDTEPDIARTRVIQRDLSIGENGGTLESVTEFADWWDSLVHPLLLKEESWKYVNIIVSGSQFDSNSNNLLVHIANNTAEK